MSESEMRMECDELFCLRATKVKEQNIENGYLTPLLFDYENYEISADAVEQVTKEYFDISESDQYLALAAEVSCQF
jgi:hypothetical protein